MLSGPQQGNFTSREVSVQFQFIFLNSTTCKFIKLINEQLTKLQEYKVITKS